MQVVGRNLKITLQIDTNSILYHLGRVYFKIGNQYVPDNGDSVTPAMLHEVEDIIISIFLCVPQPLRKNKY